MREGPPIGIHEGPAIGMREGSGIGICEGPAIGMCEGSGIGMHEGPGIGAEGPATGMEGLAVAGKLSFGSRWRLPRFCNRRACQDRKPCSNLRCQSILS